MKIPIGISDFKEVIEDGYYYVDKTLFIEELKHTNGKVLLIPRPRCFGKTLNLSMLKYFYEISETSNAYLFHKTAIWGETPYRSLQGAYPVIFITFKSCKDRIWSKVYADMTDVITQEFRRHFDHLAPTLQKHELDDYLAIVNRTASQTLYTNSLFFLTTLLHRSYKKRVMVFIDEYDAPIHAAYTHGYYKQMIDFMRSLMTAVLKDNKSLERGVLTGILRSAKEGIFSGLNNLRVCTLLETKFSDKFGFTSHEVDQFLADARLIKKGALIKEWYNGYTSGTLKIYNPWSLLECIDHKGEIEAYWANTSDNELIKKLIAQSDEKVKTDLELLLEGTPIVKEIDKGLTLPGIENNQRALWSLLLFAGYLTFTKVRRHDGKAFYTLALPNEEIKLLYQELITSIFEQSLGLAKIEHLKESLSAPTSEQFSDLLQEFIIKSMSSFDIPESEPERSYHTFVLGLLVLLSDRYELKSNRESGYGRYDIMLIPHEKKQWGIIIEFKKVSPTAGETLSTAARRAIDQIKEKNYAQELRDRGVTKIAAFGIGCKGKKIAAQREQL